MYEIHGYAVKEKGGKLLPFFYNRGIGSMDVLVEIKFCSLARGDIPFIDDYWNDTKYPIIPGLEIIGVVKEIGKEVKNLKSGEYIGIGYQISSCFTCEYCLSGNEQFCVNQKVIPMDDYGGIAEHIVVDHRFCFSLPENLRSAQAAPLLCSGLTSFTAIRKAGIKPYMKVGVIGIGNLGHLAIQILSKMNCEVTAFTHTTSKEETLRKLGASFVTSSVDIKELSKIKRHYDFIINTSSESLEWEYFIQALKPAGILCFVGLSPKEVSFKAELLADYAQRTILGSYVGSRKDMKDFLVFASENNILALSEVFKMSDANTVLERLREHQIPFSVVLEN